MRRTPLHCLQLAFGNTLFVISEARMSRKLEGFTIRITSSPFMKPGKRLRDHVDDSITQEPSKRVREGAGNRECVICSEGLPIAFFPEETHSDAEHQSEICLLCWELHLDNEVTNKSWDTVRCGQCKKTLTNDNIKRFATSQKHNEYVDFRRHRFRFTNKSKMARQSLQSSHGEE